MGGVSRLRKDLSGYSHIVIDTMILIYVLEKHQLYFPLARQILKNIESGQNPCFISAVTLTELLTAPAQADDLTAMRDYEMYLLNFPHLTIVPIDVEVATEAAHLRASTGLPTPDAIILATAVQTKAKAIITNDKRWRNKLSDIDIILLEDYLVS